MKISQLLSFGMTTFGSLMAGKALLRRMQWEDLHKDVAICVDFDDLVEAATRAGWAEKTIFERAAEQGATHVSLPEWTLDRLLTHGQLTPHTPTRLRVRKPKVAHWNYLRGDAELVEKLAAELTARLPYTQASVTGKTTLFFAGDLTSIRHIGLGFDDELAQKLMASGLQIVPRPVSYPWPEPALIDRTIEQAGRLGRLVAFDGEWVLGHEMQLGDTLHAMEHADLTMVFFAESRHQRGDWFIARGRLPNVILGHRFSPEEMHEMDGHAASHRWVHLANERGMRFFYLNFFRVLHATEPLEGLGYIHQTYHALIDAGYHVTAQPALPEPIPEPSPEELAYSGLAAAGISAAMLRSTFDLPEIAAVPLTILGAGGAAALPFVEQAGFSNLFSSGHHHSHDHEDEHVHDHDHHHHHHHHHDHGHEGEATSYAPKLFALAAAVSAPAAMSVERSSLTGIGLRAAYQVAGAIVMAQTMSGRDYHLRVEDFKGYNLDWLLPLAAAGLRIRHAGMRIAVFAGLFGGWLYANRVNVDVLALVDPDHESGHTHHFSAATRIIGDTSKRVGPRPARKWAGASLASAGLAGFADPASRPVLSGVISLVGALAGALGLVGFRRPERTLRETLRLTLPSLGVGAALGLVLHLASKFFPKGKKG